MVDGPDVYTPSYSMRRLVCQCQKQGVYGTELHSNKSIATQINEAKLLFDLIQTQDPIQYANLTHTSAPMPVLVKVPGEGRVKMLLGLAQYKADPFVNPKPPIDGKYLALREDIDDPKEPPTVIIFNDTVMTLLNAMAPTMKQFIEKMEKKDDRNDGSLWFKQSKVAATTVAVAQICPIPAVYAYDALMETIPAHILWERIKVADLQAHEDLRTYILNFLQAAHTDHNASNVATVDIGAANPFMARQDKDAKQWAKERAAKIFETVRVAGTVAAAMPASSGGATQAPQYFQKIAVAEAMIALGNQQRTMGTMAVVAHMQQCTKHTACAQ